VNFAEKVGTHLIIFFPPERTGILILLWLDYNWQLERSRNSSDYTL